MTLTAQKVGTEFLVNTQTARDQSAPSITMLEGGGFVVSWQDASGTLGDASGYSIKAQIFDTTGSKLGGEFLINTQTAFDQFAPTITGLMNGGFVVSWLQIAGTLGDPGGYGIKAQIFNASGGRTGTEFLVNTQAANVQSDPTVTGLTNGRFVVSWQDASGTLGDSGGYSIKAQVFDAAGSKFGSEFLVNTQTAGSQLVPTITGLADGGFVVSWQDVSGTLGDGSAYSIKAQVFDATGSKRGSETLVNTQTADSQVEPNIASLANGGFVIAWHTENATQDGSGTAIKAQVFTASGTKAGPEFLVNTEAASFQYQPTIAGLADGNFVVSWWTDDIAQDGSGNAIKAQVFTAAGAKVGTEFLVNTQTANSQYQPTITGTADGGFVISWWTNDSTQDGSNTAIKAQIFALVPDNAPPVIDGGPTAAFDIAENTAAVASFTATDPDAGDTVVWSLSGDDAGLFAIDAAGVLSFVAAPDFEAPADLGGDNIYNVTVIASDGDASDEQAVEVTVTNTTATDTLRLDGAFPDTQVVEPGFGFGRVVGVGNNDRVVIGLPGGALSVGASLDGTEITLDWDNDAVTDLGISGVPELEIHAAAVTVSGDLSATGLSPDTITYFGDDGANSFDASLLTSNESIEAWGYGGADTLIGSGGNDFLLGGDNDDLLRGLDGQDYLIGGSGIDTASYAGIIAGIAATTSDWEVGDGTANDQLDSVEIVDDAAAGRYLLVGNGGFATIQAAVDAASAGDTIIVAAGSYAETVTIDKALTLLGAKAGVAGTDAGRDAAGGAGETSITGKIRVTSSADVTIDGVRMVNTGGGAGAETVQFKASAAGGNHVLTNSILWSPVAGGAVGDRAIGSEVTASGAIIISGVYVTGASAGLFDTASWDRGLWFDGGGIDLSVIGNRFEYARTAINVDAAGTSGIVITGNDFVSSGSGISAGLNAGALLGGINANSFENVGTEFNFRNLTSDLVFNAGFAVGTLVPGFGANDPVVVLGGGGNDSLIGTAGVDVLDGNNVNAAATDADTLDGGAGADFLFGKGGNDLLIADTSDTIDGGAGFDTAVFAAGTTAAAVVAAAITTVELIRIDGAAFDTFVVEAGMSIQAAINAAADGDIIVIAAGTYTEQLTISGRSNLTLQTAGNGEVIIKAPATLAVNGASDHWGDAVRAVIAVGDSTGIMLSGLGIDGSFAGDTTPGSNGDELAGIAFLNSSGSIDGVTVTNVSNSIGGGLFGLQHGVGILIDNSSSSGDAVSITGTTVSEFQKTGILAWGVEDLAIINGQIIGVGATDLIAQNGIQIGGSAATVTGNSIGDIGYSPASVYGAGLIVYEPTGATVIDGNAFTGAGAGSAGLDLTDTQGQPVTITNNVFTGLDYGILGYSFAGGALGLDVDPVLAGNSFANIAVLGLYIDPEFSVFDPFTTTTAFTLTGTDFDDELAGSDGDDSFTGGVGADSINGRAGTDTAVFAGDWSYYTIGFDAGAFTLTGVDGPDTVRNVENFVFADGTLTAAELLNDAPFDLVFADVSIAENTAPGTAIGTATANDADSLDTLSYSLVNDADGRFTIDATTGIVSIAAGAVLDREAAASHAITVAVTDLGGLTVEVDALVSLTDVDEFDVTAPVDTDAAANSVAENAVAGTIVGVIAGASDADATTSAVSYALTDNAGGRFAIDSATGVITVLDGSLLDFEAAASHDVEVTATSADGSSAATVFAIAVANVVEPQFFIGTSAAETFTAPTDDDWTVDARGGADTITTAGGDDSVAAGLGNDVISTGGGNDILLFKGNSSANGFDTVNGGSGDDELRALANNTVISLASVTGVELVNANGFSNVVVQGSTGANVLDFTGATMTGIIGIRGGGGTDTITGSIGDDIIRGDAGNDILAGGDGNDSFQVGLNHGQDSIDGGDGFDSVLAIANNTRIGIASHTGLEAISANGFANVTLVGTTGADLLDFSGVSLTGIAAIDAGGGNDEVIGSAGADIIKAGAGIDTLTGGGGADIFDFDLTTNSRTGGAYDLITDFETGVDKIDLSSIDAITSGGATGNQAFAFIGSSAFTGTAGELRYDTSLGGVTRIFGDTDGNGVANFEIQLAGTLLLTAGDFIA